MRFNYKDTIPTIISKDEAKGHLKKQMEIVGNNLHLYVGVLNITLRSYLLYYIVILLNILLVSLSFYLIIISDNLIIYTLGLIASIWYTFTLLLLIFDDLKEYYLEYEVYLKKSRK